MLSATEPEPAIGAIAASTSGATEPGPEIEALRKPAHEIVAFNADLLKLIRTMRGVIPRLLWRPAAPEAKPHKEAEAAS
jgi:hypothetical protein